MTVKKLWLSTLKILITDKLEVDLNEAENLIYLTEQKTQYYVYR